MNKEESFLNNIDNSKILKQKRLKRIILSLFFVSILFFITTLYSQYKIYTLKKIIINSSLNNKELPVTPEEIIRSLSKHILLPSSIPKIATVEDAKKLNSSQPFFENAENGDVVIVYETEILLYRPSKDILIAVGDVSGQKKQ